jgi:hypothetical protein
MVPREEQRDEREKERVNVRYLKQSIDLGIERDKKKE